MDPMLTPNGTLSQLPSNPLVDVALGRQQPTAQDTAGPLPTPGTTVLGPGGSPVPQPNLMPRPSGGASMAQILASRGQTAPAFTSPHVNKIGDNVSAALQKNPQMATQPGGWAKALVGGAADALRTETSALGDAAAVGTVPDGGGALVGVARTMAARNQRLRQEKIDQSDISKNQQAMAEANVRMMHEQRLISKLDEDARQASVDSGLRQIAVMRSQPSPTPALGEHLDSDEIEQYIKDKKINPAKETAVPDGVKVVGVDKDGNPIKRMTYTLMGVPADVKLDPENEEQKGVLDELNKYAPPANGGKWGDGGTQSFTGTEFNLAMQHAADVRAATMARNQTLINGKLAEAKQTQDMEAVNFRGVTDWVNALSHTPNGDVIAARNAMLADPNMRQKYPNLDNDLREYYGKDEKTGVYNYDKLLEKHQEKIDQAVGSLNELSKKLDTAHGEDAAAIAGGLTQQLNDPNTPPSQLPQIRRMIDRATAEANASADFKANEAEQAAKAKKKIEEQQPVASEADKALVTQIGEGRSAYPNTRTKEGERLASLVAVAYPDFDEGKAPAWFSARKNFTSGKLGDGLNSSNTALEHMQRAYEHTTVSALLSEDYNKLKTDTTFITGELGKAVKGGVISEGEADHIRQALSGGLTVQNRRDRLKEASQLLMDKIDNYQQQFQDAAPTKYITVPTLLKPGAKASFDFIQSDGKQGRSITQSQQQTQQQQRAVIQLPDAARSQLQKDKITTFKNGQSWTLDPDGNPIQVQAPTPRQ